MMMEKVFEALRLSPREIKVLGYLMNHKQCTSIDVQRAENLQQPEVSMATKQLLQRKYITAEVKIIKTKDGARKIIIYTLVEEVYKLMADELKTIVADMLNKSDTYASLIEELETQKREKATEEVAKV